MAKTPFIEKFEKEFEKLSVLHRSLVYFVMTLFIAAASFKFVIPYLSEKERELKDKIEVLKSDIERNDFGTLQKKIKLLNEEFLRKNSEREKLKEDFFLLKSKLGALSFRVDDKKITDILNMLLEKSLELNLDIEYIKPVSKEGKEKKSVEPKKEIHIKGKGEFINIVYFLHFIEEMNVLSDIKEIELKKGKDKVDFSLIWLIYGMKL